MTDLATQQTKRTPVRILAPLGILLALAMALTTTVFSPSEATAQAAAGPNTEFTVGTYDVEPGDEFEVTITIDPVEVDVAGVAFELRYDPTVLEPILQTDPNVGVVNAPTCTSITPGSSICGPLNPTDSIRGSFLIANITGPFIKTKTDVLSISFRVISDSGATPLTFVETQAGNTTSEPTTAIDGSVSVAGGAAPTPTPTPTPTPEPEPTDVFCRGELVTINMRLGDDGVGTSGDDVILGTFFDDVIDGGAGDDTICGGGGNDTIYGGDGGDQIWAGGGDDIVAAGDDNDTVSGGTGNDTISGDAGDDDLRGGPGDDLIRGNRGHDLIRGGGGIDEVRGGPDDDEVRGGADNDLVAGGQGDDLLKGNDGDDKLVGGAGTNVLNGGNDTDECVSEAGATDKLVRCEPA